MRKKPAGFYERAADFSEKLINVRPSVDDYKKLDEDIKSAYMVATPTGVFSLTIFSFLFVMLLVLFSFLLNLGLGFAVFILILGLAGTYYIYSFPAYQGRVVLAKMSADTILAILYMIVYMRSSPNLEGAVRFSSENLKGPLSWDLKKLMWDIQVGSYPSADTAVANYIEKWKTKNPEFAESLNLLRGTASNSERREKLFEETINVILNGTRERTKHYVASLRMPVMLIHAMGVLLPVMGLVLFPIILIFMSDKVSPFVMFLGYDVLLPLFLWFVIDYLLRQRPPTFSQPDISIARGIPPLGKFSFQGKEIPILPISLAVFLVLGGFGASQFLSASGGVGVCSDASASVNASLLLIVSIGLAIFVYAFLDSLQKMRVREDIEKIEDEFSVALFQLGNQISSGTPIELAVEKAGANLRGMKIANLFSNSSQNMRRFGMTFEDSIFNKDSGAIWYYPSNLIRSIMGAIIQSSKKSMAAASEAMVSISQYLKGVHDVKEDVKEILGETTTSMKFLGTFLTPMVAGVTITMAVVIMQILTMMGSQIAALAQSSDSSQFSGLQSGFLSASLLPGNKLPIGPGEFQLIVGLYMIETVLILAIFTNKVEYGEDAVGLRSTVAWSVLIAIFIYILSWFITYTMFGGPIREIMTPSQLTGNLAQCV